MARGKQQSQAPAMSFLVAYVPGIQPQTFNLNRQLGQTHTCGLRHRLPDAKPNATNAQSPQV